MSKDVSDRRVQKTRQLLQDAIISLISEKGFEAVTIQDILDRANVGRSTFYLHFDNKHELLHSCFDDFSSLFEQPGSRSGKKQDLKETQFIVHLLRFVERNHRLFKVLLGKYGIPIFSFAIQNYVFTYFEGLMKQSAVREKDNSIQLEMMTHYYTNAFVGTVKWWVDKDMPCTAEELDKQFRRLALLDIEKH